jgi:hypothetical protein
MTSPIGSLFLAIGATVEGNHVVILNHTKMLL